MLIYQTTRADLDAALDTINRSLYQGNITFRRCDREYTRRDGLETWRVTLTVVSSKGPGARLSAMHPWRGYKQRRLAAACWHVFGNYFDALFDVCPDARVRTAGRIVTAESGNWEDWNIGSHMWPYFYSDACLCLDDDEPQPSPDWQPETREPADNPIRTYPGQYLEV